MNDFNRLSLSVTDPQLCSARSGTSAFAHLDNVPIELNSKGRLLLNDMHSIDSADPILKGKLSLSKFKGLKLSLNEQLTAYSPEFWKFDSRKVSKELNLSSRDRKVDWVLYHITWIRTGSFIKLIVHLGSLKSDYLFSSTLHYCKLRPNDLDTMATDQRVSDTSEPAIYYSALLLSDETHVSVALLSAIHSHLEFLYKERVVANKQEELDVVQLMLRAASHIQNDLLERFSAAKDSADL